jgi:hypothetical protein
MSIKKVKWVIKKFKYGQYRSKYFVRFPSSSFRGCSVIYRKRKKVQYNINIRLHDLHRSCVCFINNGLIYFNIDILKGINKCKYNHLYMVKLKLEIGVKSALVNLNKCYVKSKSESVIHKGKVV